MIQEPTLEDALEQMVQSEPHVYDEAELIKWLEMYLEKHHAYETVEGLETLVMLIEKVFSKFTLSQQFKITATKYIIDNKPSPIYKSTAEIRSTAELVAIVLDAGIKATLVGGGFAQCEV